MFNFELRRYVSCDDSQKHICLEIVDVIYKLALLAREHGISGLVSEMENIRNNLLRLGVGLLVDNTDVDLLEEILNSAIVFSNKTGADLLLQLIIREGVSSIKRGYNPEIIKIKMYSYLGEDKCLDMSPYA